MGAITKLKDGVYIVASQWSAKSYTVDMKARSCTCPDHVYRHLDCKHVLAVEAFRERATAPAPVDPFDLSHTPLKMDPRLYGGSKL